MRLNRNPFDTYLVDTIDDIINRIACALNTMPKWLIFPNGKPTSITDVEGDNNVDVDDYLAKIRNQNSLDDIPIPYPNEVSLKDIHKVHIATNNALQRKDAQFVNNQLFAYSLKVGVHLDELKTYWRDRDGIVAFIDASIVKVRVEVEETNKKNLYMETIPLVHSTKPEITHIQFSVTMGKYIGTLYDLFNSIVPNVSVPYVRCSINDTGADLFKIYQEFKVNPMWLDIITPDIIMLKVNSTHENQSPNNYKNYTTATFALNNDNVLLGTFDTIVSSETRTPYLSRSAFIARVLQVFTELKNTIEQEKDEIITSRFAIPQQCFDTSMFADTVMIHKYLSNIVAIDESVNASRKTNTGCYVKLVNKPTSAVSLSLRQTERVGEYGMRSIGEWYVMCRTRTLTTQDIKPLQLIIQKLFSIYNREEKSILSYYKAYLDGFSINTCITAKTPTNKKRLSKKKKGLGAIEPEIFTKNYTTKCQRKSQPSIIDNEQDAFNEQGKQLEIMRFPVKGEIASDGTPFQQRMYVCKNTADGHTYPGICRTSVANIIPYAPCCYKADQKERTVYREYFFDEGNVQNRSDADIGDDDNVPVVIRENPLPDQTNASLEYVEIETMKDKPGPKYGKLDELPQQLIRFFSVMDFDPMHVYMRCGVTRTKYSSIEAVLFCTNHINSTTRGQYRAKNVNKHVHKLLNGIERYAISSKQELYNQSVQDIMDSIKSKTNCLIPSRYVHLIECLMDCDIFVFKESGLVVPDHSRMYLKYSPSKTTCLLYEHSGSIVEVIGVKGAKQHKDTFTCIFTPNEPVIMNIHKFFRTLTLSYYKGIDDKTYRQIPEIRQLRGVTGQVLDNHGKCRVFIVHNRFTFVPDIPIPPYDVPLVDVLPRASVTDALSFTKKILWKRCIGNTCREIGVSIRGCKYTVLCNDTNHHRVVELQSRPPIYEDIEKDNVIVKYQNEKKKALDLLQSTLTELLRSIKHEKDTHGTVVIDDLLREYATKLQGGLQNEENIRLMYACKQWIRSHKDDTIPQLSVGILKSIPMAYSFSGIESVRNLIKTYHYNYTTVFNRPRLNFDTGYGHPDDDNDDDNQDNQYNAIVGKSPYFFKCNNVLYLSVPTDEGLDGANRIIHSWVTNNTPYDSQQTDNTYTYRVVVFDSPDKLIEITTTTTDDDDDDDAYQSEGGLVLFIHQDKRYEALLVL